MVHALEGSFVGEDASQTHELTSALGNLLERIGASAAHDATDRSYFEMSIDEVDAMLGLHRAVPQADCGRLDEEDRRREVVEVATVVDVVEEDTVAGRPGDHLDSASDGMDELRSARIFEPAIDRRALVTAIVVPTVLAMVIAAITSLLVPSSGSTEAEALAVPTTTPLVASTTIPPTDPPPVTPVSDAVISARVESRLVAIGLTRASVSVSDGAVSVVAVAGLGALPEGYFALKGQMAEAALVEGVTDVDVRLELRGDAAALRADLGVITRTSPILFESGSDEIGIADTETLDRVAAAMIAQPGLPVIVAGTTDSSGSAAANEALARARATAVVAELMDRGVPENRLQIVSYGELFTSEGAVARSVSFEVGA